MKGYRTVILNVAALVSSLLALKGFEVSPEFLAELLAVGLPALNVLLRTITSTPIGKAE